jgi:dipeptidase E
MTLPRRRRLLTPVFRPAEPRRQIVALGGGGFTEEPDNPALDRYVLEATGRDSPRVCFLPTAGGDNSSYTVKFYRAFSELGARPSHLQLFHRTVEDVRGFLLGQDVIYVGGGNTAGLLAVWRVHGLDAVLREAWERGVVLAGLCAGSQCWFQAGITASWGPRMAPIHDGLALLPGSNCPHYAQRRDAYLGFVAAGMAPGIACDDGVALHYVGTELHRVVASRPGPMAYRVLAEDGRALETPLPPVVLAGAGETPVATAAVL